MSMKSQISPEQTTELNSLGRSYYCFCLEQAIISVAQARALVRGDVIEQNHELVKIEQLLLEALNAS